MKRLYSIIVLCCISLGWFNQANAQAPDCSGAFQSPFCSGIAQYPANFDGTGSGAGPQAPAGPNYDCLGTQGNPSYFSLTIEQSGLIDFTLDNTANVDIDFILWGPFTSIAAAGLACDSMGQGGQWGNIADCSYSSVSQEQVTIPNAQAGEVYILMVTNYANVATNIFSTQNSGSGSIACPCEIPYDIDTLGVAFGNQGYITDTTNGINQFVVCPNNTLGINVGASGSLNDTLNLYGPFTTINDAFTNNTILVTNPNAPVSFDSLNVLALITPTQEEIGVNNFNIGLRNDLYTGGFSDSSCFDLLNVQVIVPGVRLNNRSVCSGASFEVVADSIPTTILGSSSYNWRQISGPAVSFSSTTTRIPTITIPVSSSTSSNDSTVIVVDYNYGGLCPMSDTMVLNYPDMSVTASALPDSVCSGGNSNLLVTLSDTLTPALCDDYDVSIIPFAPLTTTGGTAVSNFTATSTFGATDEGISAALPIGFDFDFYCNSFNTFYIHTNGFITFNALGPNAGFLPGATLPAAGDPENIIALSWEDLDVGNGGSINYYVVGTAPNRQLVVNFNGIQNWLGSTSTTTQAILNESDNSIEIHITSNTLGVSTIGIENGDGTVAHYHSSLNATQGQASGPITNVAYRFSPKVFGPFYNWTPAATLNANNVASPVATPTATTTYTVAVQDGVCTYSDSTTVHIISGLNTPTVICDSSSVNSLSFSWSDLGLPATGFYEYSLDGGATWVNVGNVLATTATGLNSNTNYTILVRGNDGTGGACPLSPTGTNNCSTLNPSCINNPAINIALTPTNLLCNNDSSGCVSAIVTGGSGSPMNLTWSNGTVDMDTICNLVAGTYTLVVTDTISGGPGSPTISCIDSQSITITEPSVLAIVVDSFNNPFCSGSADGNIFTTATGGTPNYSYNWSNSDTTGDVTGLNNGTFTVTVTDANGCTDTAQATLTVPNPILITVDNIVDNSCAGTADGSVSITATGGVGTLTYLWNNNATTEDLAAVSNGTYIVTVTDNNGCSETAQAVVNPTILLSVTDVSVNPSCNGEDGTSTLTVSGGSGSYAFDWGAASTSTTNTATIPSGTFTVTITDNGNGCSTLDTITLVDPPVLVVTLVDTTNIGCNSTANSGAIDIQVSGGTPVYTYAWDNSATTEDLSGLAAGNYTVVVTDANGCSVTGGPYTVEEATDVTVTITTLVGNLACDLQPIGALNAVATGGSNITYTWSNNSTDSTATGLAAGNHTVTVTNSDGCTATASQTINAPVIPTVDAFVSVTGMTSVSVPLNTAVTLSAGSTGFDYTWTSIVDPVTGNANIANSTLGVTTANPDPEGDYTYIVTASATTNDTTCSVTDTVWITVEAPFQGVPTAFTPDGDGINDTFRPVTLADEEISSFRIFNRWGQEIYNGDTSHGDGWDGTVNGVPQPTEVYIYMIVYKKASDPDTRTVKGEFTLIR
ncbi:T9SS type B sorting domain-containing protein [Aureispira sp. CCB-QB1]|uniref:T9SS type B sorting domain-containing protein n=1 Tax=Aureispira sp. CCB-QB1 TaxID=1313421 RepID=UPI00069646FC|nr:T9SS type B sorting domain-containing protein [Aureispira sp. CCB-QB1]